jgi:hypothetical protein
MFRTKRTRALALIGLAALVATAGWAQMRPLGAGPVMETVVSLKPGEYVWVPQIAPQGPMLVVVNVATQKLVAYRNGVPVAVSTVSTGKPGHRTPLGIFTVLQKRARHFSSTYNNAPMPFMQRLTWRGIALHGGHLPGYPASHGCIRLPHEFAQLLFAETDLGMTVVIVDQPPQLRLGPTPERVLAGARSTAAQAPAWWRPELSPSGPVSIVVSGADRRMTVLRGGIEIGSAPVAFDGTVDRIQAYVLESVAAGDYRWRRVTLPGSPAGTPLEGVAMGGGGQFQGSDPFREALASVVVPGTTMVVIPDSLGFAAPAAAPPAPALSSGGVIAAWRADASTARGR